MVKRAFPCDPDRLRSYLDDELSSGEQAELAGHLDDCGSCQQALERLAAGSRLWAELPHLRAAAGPAVTGSGDDPDPPRVGPGWKQTQGAGREGLDLGFLAPSDQPTHLGRLGAYEIVGVLGEGGMGVVLKAFDPALSRVVAIKVLAPAMAACGSARRRFSREAKAAAAVVHDHVVAIHAVDQDVRSGLPYLVMPYIAGRSLQERIDLEGPLRDEEVLRIGRQAALGLAAAHAQGLVHRDIKPSNILLENGLERVKITDFGLARAVDDASQSQSGFVAGTPQYMSPEQALGETVDHRSDLFSLGSVLYAMCAGHSPFRAKTTMGVLRRVCDDQPRELSEINPEVPEALEAVIARLHAKDPAARYQTATEVAEELGRQLAELQRPGARSSRRGPCTASGPVDPQSPILGQAKAAADGPLRRRQRRVVAPAATVLLVLLGLTAAGTSARIAFLDGPKPPAGFASVLADPPGAGAQTGQGQPPARVIITRQEAGRTIVGSGKPATRRWDLAGFTAVAIRTSFRATVTRSDRFEITVTADDNVLEHVQVAKDGPRLQVQLEGGWTYRLRPDTLQVAIALPVLEAIDFAGAVRGTIQGFASDRAFRARVSGASTLEGSMCAGDVDVHASGASTFSLRGSARSARLSASGASTLAMADCQVEGEKVMIDLSGASTARLRGSARAAVLHAQGASLLVLGDLALEAADVVLTDSSSATIRVKGLLNYDIRSSSRLDYLGEPTIGQAKKTGASLVSRRRPGA
jgi:serine/threonine-protein kinase